MLLVNKPLKSWSWSQIIRLYKVYGTMINDLNGIKERVEMVEPNIDFDDPINIFLMRFHTDCMKVNRNIEYLDKEISRRNKLIGVV